MKLNLGMLLLFGMFFSGCRGLGLKEIPKHLSNQKWGNPKDGSRFADIHGLKVHYRDQGATDAPVIVMIHGLADSLHSWESLVHALVNDFRIIRFDVPGFGLTGGLPQGSDDQYTAKTWIKYIDGLLDKLGVKKAHIMGNSLGGYIAWNYALARPDKTQSLFLIAPAAFPVPKLPLSIRLTKYRILRPLRLKVTPRVLMSKVVHKVYADSSIVTPKLVDRYYEMAIRQGNRYSYMHVFKRIIARQKVYPEKLAELKAKTMVVFGDTDRIIPHTQLEKWQKEVPHVKTNLYPNVGHCPQVEAPGLVIDDFLQFLKDIENTL